MAPHDFPRRALLAVTGLTPQVVTETLYAMCVTGDPPFVPTEVHLVTTAEGAEQARLALLDAESGQFHAFCRDYGLDAAIDFPAANIHVIPDASGAPLEDIRTPEDNTLAADCLLGHVRSLCDDPQAAVHVSIAGGRKTMGFFVGYALSLFGRPQDRLSHVLVNAPFESTRMFYFPPARPRVLHLEKNRSIHTADARVMLAEIPFVRLREDLPRDALRHPTPFATLVAATQQHREPSLRFEPGQLAAICGGHAIKLSPALFAFYWWLARLRVRGDGEGGFIAIRQQSPDEYLQLYERLVGRTHDSLATLRATLKGGFYGAFFQEKRAKINGLLKGALSLGAEPYRVQSAGVRNHMRYGLALEPRHVELREYGTAAGIARSA
ncbi:MAG: TIGR02584 family CRISPR-associated protein [Betaproteobacteria bacterium]|nr:TIGR02584 family CRISPR-associated protein [Betaproteobacteria bacterium]